MSAGTGIVAYHCRWDWVCESVS